MVCQHLGRGARQNTGMPRYASTWAAARNGIQACQGMPAPGPRRAAEYRHAKVCQHLGHVRSQEGPLSLLTLTVRPITTSGWLNSDAALGTSFPTNGTAHSRRDFGTTAPAAAAATTCGTGVRRGDALVSVNKCVECVNRVMRSEWQRPQQLQPPPAARACAEGMHPTCRM
eukprot:365907-Chlamydomonas_euryale.AAC.29